MTCKNLLRLARPIHCTCRAKDKDCQLVFPHICHGCGFEMKLKCNRCMTCDPHTDHELVTTACYDCDAPNREYTPGEEDYYY